MTPYTITETVLRAINNTKLELRLRENNVFEEARRQKECDNYVIRCSSAGWQSTEYKLGLYCCISCTLLPKYSSLIIFRCVNEGTWDQNKVTVTVWDVFCFFYRSV